MEIISDGWLVLTNDATPILGVLSALLLAGGIIYFSFKIFPLEELTFSEYFSLCMAGGLFPLLLVAAALALLSFLLKLKADFLFFPLLATACGCLYIAGRNKTARGIKFSLPFLALILISILSIYVRLAFISRLIVPPYFDSAVHNRIIDRLIASYQASTLPTFAALTGGYYHLGFHVLTAAFSLVLHASVKDVMLVFGQVLLAIIPLPLFFIVKRLTGSDRAGLFAVLLAGWGWAMPAHAVNWGKYPALAGILAFAFTFATCLLPRPPGRRGRIALIVCLACVCISTLMHSRTLVLLGIALLCTFAAPHWQRLRPGLRKLVFLLAAGLLVAFALLVLSRPFLSPALEPYLQTGWLVSLLVLLLSVFACIEFPRETFSLVLSLALLLACLFVPVIDLLPGHTFETLLDRPFVEMALFLPLALLGGLGVAGLLKTFAKIELSQRPPQKWAPAFLVSILFALVCAHAFSRYDFYPSRCCQIFSEADAVAFDWMDKNLPKDARILIASSDIVLFESSPLVSPYGADAGIWLAPLIGRRTFSLPYLTNFAKNSNLRALRRRGIGYIYIGATGRHFREAQLRNHPALYQQVFSLPGAYVYKVLDAP